MDIGSNGSNSKFDSYVFKFGLYGAWIGAFLDTFVRMVLYVFRFKNRKWSHVKL